MIKVKIGNKLGVTSSVVPHTNGTYPIWFKDSNTVEFVEKSRVILKKKMTK